MKNVSSALSECYINSKSYINKVLVPKPNPKSYYSPLTFSKTHTLWSDFQKHSYFQVPFRMIATLPTLVLDVATGSIQSLYNPIIFAQNLRQKSLYKLNILNRNNILKIVLPALGGVAVTSITSFLVYKAIKNPQIITSRNTLNQTKDFTLPKDLSELTADHFINTNTSPIFSNVFIDGIINQHLNASKHQLQNFSNKLFSYAFLGLASSISAVGITLLGTKIKSFFSQKENTHQDIRQGINITSNPSTSLETILASPPPATGLFYDSTTPSQQPQASSISSQEPHLEHVDPLQNIQNEDSIDLSQRQEKPVKTQSNTTGTKLLEEILRNALRKQQQKQTLQLDTSANQNLEQSETEEEEYHQISNSTHSPKNNALNSESSSIIPCSEPYRSDSNTDLEIPLDNSGTIFIISRENVQKFLYFIQRQRNANYLYHPHITNDQSIISSHTSSHENSATTITLQRVLELYRPFLEQQRREWLLRQYDQTLQAYLRKHDSTISPERPMNSDSREHNALQNIHQYYAKVEQDRKERSLEGTAQEEYAPQATTGALKKTPCLFYDSIQTANAQIIHNIDSYPIYKTEKRIITQEKNEKTNHILDTAISVISCLTIIGIGALAHKLATKSPIIPLNAIPNVSKANLSLPSNLQEISKNYFSENNIFTNFSKTPVIDTANHIFNLSSSICKIFFNKSVKAAPKMPIVETIKNVSNFSNVSSTVPNKTLFSSIFSLPNQIIVGIIGISAIAIIKNCFSIPIIVPHNEENENLLPTSKPPLEDPSMTYVKEEEDFPQINLPILDETHRSIAEKKNLIKAKILQIQNEIFNIRCQGLKYIEFTLLYAILEKASSESKKLLEELTGKTLEILQESVNSTQRLRSSRKLEDIRDFKTTYSKKIDTLMNDINRIVTESPKEEIKQEPTY